ncbi:Clp protease N-terminal domain-containing protein [Saccharopolyspora taberi]|uniref:Clp protease N-terminal domain-containing protein n=1 Tax=Saccharopolyspora taberi TaxID=60895 RepID=A0ABN3VN68_9PSEU
MFERFTSAAKQAVTGAVREAQQQRAPEITSEHLLLAVLGNPTGAGRMLAEHGVTRDDITTAHAEARRRGGLTDADASALRDLGIDVDSVVHSVEDTHGPGALAAGRRRRSRFGLRRHIPFGTEAKKILEGSLREALDLGNRAIGDEHFLLAILQRATAASEVLDRNGITYASVRSRFSRAA